MSERAVALLRQLGYRNVRDYAGGLEDWVRSGEALETSPANSAQRGPLAVSIAPGLQIAADGEIGRLPARLAQNRRWSDSAVEFAEHLSTLQLFLLWISMIAACGLGFWIGAVVGEHGLIEAGKPVGSDLAGLASALYFSFVTATSVGYGDIVPVGAARAIAIAEAITALLIFGAVVAKFVSHRQDQLVEDIYRVTFDDRLDRVQSNLHVVISELLALTSICENPALPLHRVSARLDSAVLLFLGELRTTHDLLYQPRLLVEEGVLSSILANLASALDVLAELLGCLPAGFVRSQPLQIGLVNLTRLAQDICGTCVPHEYTPRLVFWMDRIQETARKIR